MSKLHTNKDSELSNEYIILKSDDLHLLDEKLNDVDYDKVWVVIGDDLISYRFIQTVLRKEII